MRLNFKVGDWVRPVRFDRKVPAYEVRAIYSDAFGDVLLREVDGSGYSADYCNKVRRNKNSVSAHGASIHI